MAYTFNQDHSCLGNKKKKIGAHFLANLVMKFSMLPRLLALLDLMLD